MKYAPVIFDMFGTLVDSFSQETYHRVVTDMASVLSAPADKLLMLPERPGAPAQRRHSGLA